MLLYTISFIAKIKIVYHCRSSNAWADDLALTATYFPKSRLTFAILFGCIAHTETSVLDRLSRAKAHVTYPMVLPGLFAELEWARMGHIVGDTLDEIEGAIFELDRGQSVEGMSNEDPEKGKAGTLGSTRRTKWMNTAFLRNSLRIWKNQLEKMVRHVDELADPRNRRLIYGPEEDTIPGGVEEVSEERSSLFYDEDPIAVTVADTISGPPELVVKIKDRLHVIIEEYDDKIHECTMSIDGMTIATQWVR